MNECTSFYQQNNEVLKFEIPKDINCILLNHYISRKENIQRLEKKESILRIDIM